MWLGPSLQRLCERINTTQHPDPPDVTACSTAVQTLQAAHSAQRTNCTACKPHRLTSQPAPQLSKLYKQHTQCNGQTAPPDVTACTTAVQTLQAAHSAQRTNCTAWRHSLHHSCPNSTSSTLSATDKLHPSHILPFPHPKPCIPAPFLFGWRLWCLEVAPAPCCDPQSHTNLGVWPWWITSGRWPDPSSVPEERAGYWLRVRRLSARSAWQWGPAQGHQGNHNVPLYKSMPLYSLLGWTHVLYVLLPLLPPTIHFTPLLAMNSILSLSLSSC